MPIREKTLQGVLPNSINTSHPLLLQGEVPPSYQYILEHPTGVHGGLARQHATRSRDKCPYL